MRVISGTARGRKLSTLEGLEVRPTAERVKEGIFSAIQFELTGRRVLDLFAGSGQLGIEALSRGAAEAIFVDQNPAVIEVLRANLTNTGFLKQSIIKNTDYRSFIHANNRSVDIVFLDPPYSKGFLTDALPLIEPYVAKDGIIICESRKQEDLPLEVGEFAQSKCYQYGIVKITMYRRKKPAISE